MRNWTSVYSQIKLLKNDYDYSKSVFSTMNSNIEIICPIHGSFFQTPKNHIAGKKCKKCSLGYKHTLSHYINLLNTLYNNKYEYMCTDVSKYVPKRYKINVKCKVHGIFNTTIESHLRGAGCLICKKELKELEYAKSKSELIHLKYNNITVISKKFNSLSDIKCRCNIHGIFNVNIQNILHSITNVCKECKLNNIHYNSVSEKDIIANIKSVHGNKYNLTNVKYIDSTKSIILECHKHGKFNILTSNIYKGQGCRKCTKFTSKHELSIQKLVPKSTLNNRTLIKPLELDIYSKEHKLAIEYNGLMWHSFGYHKSSMFNNFLSESKNKNKHLNKTNLCEDKGIQLYHIFENEWLHSTKQLIWKSMINNKIGNSKRIYARKCFIKEISSKELSTFLELNHLQGKMNAKIKLGLFYNNKLVQVMTFRTPTQSKYKGNNKYELSRLCSLINTSVIGGPSKLLNYFEKKYNPKVLISYANRRWSTNNSSNVYVQLGFKYNNTTPINYFYFKINENKLYSRNKYQKHKLSNILVQYDINKTETQNMYNNNYRKIYDSGNLLYIKEYNAH